MLLIGSQALKFHYLLPEGRVPKDWDYICTFEEFQVWCKANKQNLKACYPLSGKKYIAKTATEIFEFEIAWPDDSAWKLLNMPGHIQLPANSHPRCYVADIVTLFLLKMSHRFLKNSPHFKKTMDDIWHLFSAFPLRELPVTFPSDVIDELTDEYKEWYLQREKETYVYKHPKLDQSKEGFFSGDGIRYVYDHDTIHLTQAMSDLGLPAYTFYMKDGAEVMTDKEKFFSVPEIIRLYGVYEESCVLALERSQIPNEFKVDPQWSFKKALEKVCTSITSGWFREYAWNNYYKVIDLYEGLGYDDYIKRFERNKHLLEPFKKSQMV